MKLTEVKLKQMILQELNESSNWKDALKNDIETVERIVAELDHFYSIVDIDEGFCLYHYMETKTIESGCEESIVLEMYEFVKEKRLQIYNIAEKYGVVYKRILDVPDRLRRKLRRKYPPPTGTGYKT